MQYPLSTMLLRLFLCYFLVTLVIHSSQTNSYGDKSTLEISGGTSFNYDKQDSTEILRFYFTPTLNYFIVDALYLGLTPIFTVRHQSDSTETFLNPAINLGYVVPLESSYFWYLELSPGVAFHFPEKVSQPLHYNISFESGIKISFGEYGLATLGVNYSYFVLPNKSSSLPEHSIALGIAFGVYFNSTKSRTTNHD